MGIQCVLNGTIIEQASEMLVLSLLPSGSLEPSRQKEKIQNIHARNRVLRALSQTTKKIDPKTAELIQGKIEIVRKFFETIGGVDENEISELGFFNVLQKSIEGPIPASILLSLKPNEECTSKELREKQDQKELRDQIIQRALEKAKDHPEVVKLLKELLHCFGMSY